MARLVCGIDVGSRSVRAAVVRGGLRASAIAARFEVPFAVRPEDGEPVPGALEEAFSAIAARLPPGTDVICTAVPGDRVTARQMRFPRAALRQADAAIRLELDGVLPFEVTDAVFDHLVLSGPGEDPAQVLVVVARAEPVSRLSQQLADARMDPTSVGAGALPLAALVPPDRRGDPAEVACILDIGRNATEMLVLRGRRPVFLRAFRAGSEELTAALARTFRMSPGEAEDLKRRTEIPVEGPALNASARAMLDAVEAGMSPLLAPLRRTMLELRGFDWLGRRVDRIWITGGGSLVPGLAPWLSSRLGLPVEPLAGVASLPGGALPPDETATYGRALGLALSTGAARTRYADLRKGELRYRGDTAAARSKLRGVYLGLALLFLAWAFGAWSRCASLDAERASQERALEKLTQETMGRKMTDFDLVVRGLDRADLPVEGPMPESDVLDMLNELSRRMPSDIRNNVTLLDIESGKLTMSGQTRNAEEAARIPKVLEEYTDCIRDVGTLSGSGSAGDYTYQIEATTKCP